MYINFRIFLQVLNQSTIEYNPISLNDTRSCTHGNPDFSVLPRTNPYRSSMVSTIKITKDDEYIKYTYEHSGVLPFVHRI